MAADAVLVLVHDGAEITLGRVACRKADVALVDALARLHLAAKRLGYHVQLREVSEDLAVVLSLVGLEGLLGEPRRQAEGCEQLGVEEVVDLDDPVTRHFEHL